MGKSVKILAVDNVWKDGERILLLIPPNGFEINVHGKLYKNKETIEIGYKVLSEVISNDYNEEVNVVGGGSLSMGNLVENGLTEEVEEFLGSYNGNMDSEIDGLIKEMEAKNVEWEIDRALDAGELVLAAELAKQLEVVS